MIVRYGYDTLGEVTGVWVTPTGGAEQVVASGVTWLPFGPILTYTLGNGQTVSRTDDASYNVTAVLSPALELRFTLDYMGNIKAVTETSGASATYLYDPLYRLTSVNDATGKAIETYTYNPTGDRLSKTAPGAYTGAYKYQAPTHWLTATGTASRTYDANGNTTGNAAAGTVWGYGYNGRNRMTVVQQGGSTVGTYVYNANNERVAKTASKVTTRFVYDDASQLVSEASGTTRREYVAIGGLPVAVLDGGMVPTIGFVTADGLGSPRAVTSAGGAIIWNWPYSLNPFGENRALSASGYVLNLRLPGQYADGEAGLKYNINRSFDAASGRYLQSDPIGLEGGPTTYAYVDGRPLEDIDPNGLSTATFNKSTHTVTIRDRDGNIVSEQPAANNAQRGSRGAWADGTYNYSYSTRHPDDAPNSSYGTNGNAVFNVPGCTGCGLHSGRAQSTDRAGRTGVNFATNGCIRTTDAATGAIRLLERSGDPLTTLTVEH